MPHHFRLPGARLVSICLLVCCLAGLGAILAASPFIGSFLHTEDTLARSDAILVFAGTRAERPLEAYDLYRSGYAPVIVLTHEALDGGQMALAHRGIPLADSADLARELLVRLGVPSSAVLLLPAFHDSTADEAASFRQLISARRWHRVIAVTSKMHTRRARMTLVRRLRGLDVQVLMRASRYDPADPAHWWRRRADRRFTLLEVQKYLWYWITVMA